MKNFKNIICILVSFLILFSSMTAFAENINVYFNKITINVNGEKVTGNNILYNDRTYVPLRAISEMFSKEVVWNEETNTVDISDIEGMLFKGNAIGKMGDFTIYSDEYRIFEEISSVSLKNKNKDKEISEEELKEETIINIKKYISSLILLKENNLSLPKDFSSEFDETFKKTNEYYMSQGLGENGFIQLIEFMGYTYDSYKFDNLIKKAYSILSSHYMKTFSDEELKNYYNENISSFKKDMVQAKHILLTTEGKSEEEIKTIEKKINDIHKKIKKGADFDKLMEEFCEDPGIKSNPDGYIFGEGEMVKEFEEAAFNLKKIGDVSDVIKSSYGFHIIKLVDKFDTAPFDKVKSSINSTLNKNYLDNLLKEKADNVSFEIDTSLINNDNVSEDEIFSPGIKDIDVSLNSVKLNVNGSPITGDNILYNGRTYVPLRIISEILSKEVLWNADTNTADINDNYSVIFVSDEEELDIYKSIIKAENKETDEETITEKAKTQMKFDRKVVSFASSLGIKPDKTFEDEYKNYISSIKSQLSQTGNVEEAFKMLMDSMGYSEKSIKRIFEIDYLNEKLLEKFYDELKPSKEEVHSYYESNKELFRKDGLRVKHILLYTIDDYGNPLDEETIKNKESLITSLYEKAKKGEDFDSLMKEYSEDETIGDYPDGYTLTEGMMDPDFEKAAYSIENAGDVCKPFLSKYGYHIIKLEEKIPYYSIEDEGVYSFIEQNLCKTNLTEKIKNS